MHCSRKFLLPKSKIYIYLDLNISYLDYFVSEETKTSEGS